MAISPRLTRANAGALVTFMLLASIATGAYGFSTTTFSSGANRHKPAAKTTIAPSIQQLNARQNHRQLHGFSKSPFALFARDDDDDFESEEEEEGAVRTPAKRSPPIDPVVQETSLLLRRLSWFSWWAQLILTTVSSVTLVFASNVMRRATAGVAASADAISLPNFVLVGSSLILSFLSIFWTWATRRLARRLLKKATTRNQAANMLRKDITIGVTLNIVGMFLTLLGAEQIVGALAIKVLTTSTRGISLMTADTSSYLQPLDILIVQANTNTLFSHFVSLAVLLYLTKSVTKLDPRRNGDNDSS